MRTGMRAAALALGLLQATTGSAMAMQAPAVADGRPAQAQCAAVRDVDFRALARERAREIGRAHD